MSLPTEFIAHPDAVMLDLRARSGPEAVRILHRRVAAGTEAVSDPPRFLGDLLDRMSVAPVCIADDVALPHARTDAVTRIVLAVARAVEPIAFDTEHPAVRLVFLIGTPKRAVAEYLQAVAVLSRVLRHAPARADLLAAESEAEFRALLADGVTARR